MKIDAASVASGLRSPYSRIDYPSEQAVAAGSR